MSNGRASLIGLLTPQTIVEFGSYKGSGTIMFLNTAKSIGLSTKIYCIDTWLGSIEHWLDYFPNSKWSRAELKIKDGEPKIFEEFKKNISKNGFHDNVEIFRSTTKISSAYLQQKKFKCDLIYVDADHTFPSVFNDLTYAEKIRSETGQIAGDDYFIPSVRFGVLIFCLLKSRKLFTHSDKETYLISNVSIQDIENFGFKKKNVLAEFCKWLYRVFYPNPS